MFAWLLATIGGVSSWLVVNFLGTPFLEFRVPSGFRIARNGGQKSSSQKPKYKLDTLLTA
jgi:hypothetical protein